jgi:hydroxymethylpyrimidine pyrophosphatase-like HAD family hydrolase
MKTVPDMKKPIIFSDLDDTIFQTARKMKNLPSPERLASAALNGSHSYMSEAQSVMMDWLLGTTRFIPVTARSTEALSRCTLPFDDYRVCSNGAVILLPDGTADLDWLEKSTQQANAAQEIFEAMINFVAAQKPAERYRCWTVEEFGTGYYFCVKSNDGEQALDDIEDGLSALAGTGLVRHRNDNNLSFTPAGISKRLAVEYLSIEVLRDGAVPVFGMGDSLTDLPFMATCDMLVIPRQSQISRDILHLGTS